MLELKNLKDCSGEMIASYVHLRNTHLAALLTRSVTAEETRAWLVSGEADVWVAIAGGEVAGAATLYTRRKGEVALFTRRGGEGTGAALLAHLEARAPIENLWAWVRGDNAPALRFFRAHGYRDVGPTQKIFAGNVYDGHRFEKSLREPSLGVGARLKPYIGAALALVLCAFWARRIDGAAFASELRGLRFVYLLPAVAAYLALFWTYAARTRVLLAAIAATNLRTRLLFELSLLGAYASLVMPGMGELVKMRWFWKNSSVSYEASLQAALFEKVCSLFLFSALAACVYCLLPHPLAGAYLAFATGISALALVALFLFPALPRALIRVALALGVRKLAIPGLSVDAEAGGGSAMPARRLYSRRTQVDYLLWSLARVALECTMFWAILRAMNVSLDGLALVFIRLVTIVVTMLPLAPAALGTFELTSVVLLGFYGVPRESALAVALLERTLCLALLVPCGAFLWHRIFQWKSSTHTPT